MRFRRISIHLAVVAAATATVAVFAAEPQTAPRTEWGDPDLRGLWSNATVTPMERADALGDKTHFTEEEAEALRGTGLESILSRVESAFPVEAKTTGELNETFLEPGTEVVRSRRTSLVVDPPDGKIPFTQEGRQRRTQSMFQLAGLGPLDSHEDLHMGSRCLMTGFFYFPSVLYLHNHQIFQTPDHLAILSENGPQLRVIPLDRRPAVDEDITLWDGSSRGHWEGDTLIIETTNFNGRNPFIGATAGLRLVERLTRFDENTIDYSLTVTDPASYTRPWTLENTLRATEGPIYEFACHEGNYGLPNILSGARAEEKAAAEQTRDDPLRSP